MLVMAAVLLVATASVPAVAVALLQRATHAMVTVDPDGLWPVLVGMAALYTGHGVAVVVRTALTKGVAWRMAADLRANLHACWLTGPASGDVGGRLAALTDEVDQVQYGVSAAVTAVRNPLTLLGLGAVATWAAPGLAGPALVLLLPVAGVAWGAARWVRYATSQRRRARAALMALLAEQLAGQQTLRAFGAVPGALARLQPHNQRDRRALLRLDVVRAIPTLGVQIMAALAVGGLCWWGVTRVQAGTLQVADLVAFVAALVLARRPLTGLAEVWALLQRSLGALERVQGVLDEARPATHGQQVLPDGPLELRWSGVGVVLNGQRILSAVTATAQPSELVAIAGPTGVGKTTLLRTAWGALAPCEGVVTLGGVDLQQLAPGQLRCVAVVPQDLWLFAGSVRDNVTLGRPDAPDDVVVDALQRAGIGWALDTPVEPGGQGLSGGERQRLALARALVTDARVLLLDEPTSQVDPGTTQAILATLRELAEGRTVVVVAHDEQVVRAADRVITLGESPWIA